MWREFEFFFMVVQHAIVPRLSINKTIEHWPDIRKRLMENSRKRKAVEIRRRYKAGGTTGNRGHDLNGW